jgi:hypothetical protein
MVASRLTAMNSLGGPTIVGDAAYGVTTSGGSACRQADGTIDAAGCGTMYRFEPTGRFTVVRTFQDDAKAPFGMPAPTSDAAWLYGTSGQNGSGGAAGASLYKMSNDGLTFASLQHAVGYSEVTLSKNAAYVFKNEGTSATLERVSPSGNVEDLATFTGKIGIVAPLVRRDGSIAVMLNEFHCGVEIDTLEGHTLRKLFERRSDDASGGRCFHAGEPAWGLTLSNAELLSTNPHEIVRIRPDGSRATSIRLPKALGDFVGGLVLRNGAIFALSASESARDPICTRLLRIRGEKSIDVVHAFVRARRRCLPNLEYVLPRLAVGESSFVVSTSSSPGSIVWLRGDGTESAAHDFVQAANITDGARPNLTTALDGAERAIRVTFLRSGPPTAQPFTLDADGLSIDMKDRWGGSRRLRASDTGTLVSNLSPSDYVGNQEAKGQQIVTVDFPIPPDLPEGIYFPHLGSDPSAHDSEGETLGVARDLSDVITTTTDAELDRLRTRYLGKDVFAVVNGNLGVCADTKTTPSLRTDSPLRVVSITRKAGLPDRIPLGIAVPLSFHPFSILLKRPAPPSHARQACPILTTTQPGAWEFERSFSLHPAIDRNWPRAFRSAHIPMVGMTHAMVAALWGYPRDLNNVAELSRQSEWDYDVFDIIKFHGDRVSAVVMKNQP